eukprot:2007058-Pleurochrysis_carterae.AAC.1
MAERGAVGGAATECGGATRVVPNARAGGNGQQAAGHSTRQMGRVPGGVGPRPLRGPDGSGRRRIQRRYDGAVRRVRATARVGDARAGRGDAAAQHDQRLRERHPDLQVSGGARGGGAERRRHASSAGHEARAQVARAAGGAEAQPSLPLGALRDAHLARRGYDRGSRRGLVEWAAALLAHNLLLRGGEIG